MILSFVRNFFYFFDENVKKIIVHNQKKFIINNESKNLVLVDYTENKQCFLPYSYVLNALCLKHNAKLVTFKVDIALSFIKNLAHHFFFFFSIFPFSIYKSFGTKQNIFYTFNKKNKNISKRIFINIVKKIKTKDDVLNIQIKNIKIGDLIYDHYLKKYHKYTVNYNDKRFLKFLYKSILIFIYWDNFFKDNNVKAISVTHAVYLTGIPTRLAIFRKIPVYHMNLNYLFKLDKINDRPYLDFKYSKIYFKELSFSKRNNLMKLAKQRIGLRLNKNLVGIDMSYSSKSAWLKKKNTKRVLIKSSNIKILIATHCFFDSPHGYGNMIFPDFYEWLNFLGKFSSRTDYDWYLKSHPDFLPKNKNILNYFVNKYPKFNLLDPNTSHHQIIDDGVDFVLTCHGTIGFEYAMMNIPVINASLSNPHIKFNFNIHARSIKNYIKILSNLNKLKIKINRKEIYQYYAMRFLNSKIDYIFSDTQKIFRKYNFDEENLPTMVFNDFIKHYSNSKHKKIINIINNFINSGDYILRKKHFLKSKL
jgi:hypothetical protein